MQKNNNDQLNSIGSAFCNIGGTSQSSDSIAPKDLATPCFNVSESVPKSDGNEL